MVLGLGKKQSLLPLLQSNQLPLLLVRLTKMRGNKLLMLLPLLPARIILGIILLDIAHAMI
jgi:hypothetical protein